MLRFLALPLLMLAAHAQTPAPEPKPAQPSAPAAPAAEEKPVVTKHQITAGNRTLAYTVTAGTLPILNAAGETEADVFFMAYTLDNASPAQKRPLMFSFNGGPGSSSVWLHLGALGAPAREDARRRRHARASLPAGGQRVHLARTRPTWCSSIRSAPATAARARPSWARSSGTSRATFRAWASSSACT